MNVTDLLTPECRAYHRDQRYAIDSALKCAMFDHRVHPWTDYPETVCWLLEWRMFEDFQRCQEYIVCSDNSETSIREVCQREQTHPGARFAALPGVETYGRIVEFDTRSEDASNDLDHVRTRTFECRNKDCEKRRKYFG